MGNDSKHMVQIEDELYNNIKDYCKLNNLKITSYVNELLKKEHMISLYGESPFDNFQKKITNNIEEIPEPIQEVINEHFDELIFDKEEPKEEIIEPVVEPIIEEKPKEENTVIGPKVAVKPPRKRRLK